MSPALHTVRIRKGSLVIGGKSFLPGDPVSVEEGLFQWLNTNKPANLRFEEVAPAGVPEVPEESDEDQKPEGQDFTGEGEDVTGGGEDEETTGASIPAPASTSDAPASPPAGPALAAIDSKVSSALAAAGWDTLEKLATAKVEDLVKVPGIGKVRAEAILSEVRG